MRLFHLWPVTALLCLLIIGCSTESNSSQTSIPTAEIALAPSATLGVQPLQKLSVDPTPPLTESVPTVVPPTAPVEEAPVSPEDQFRRWMEEAHQMYPYSESVDAMWAVMLCESSGNPEVVGAGIYHGLFQYTTQTWSGEWNPYRDRSIFDPQAQIFATAKAWQEGNQHWWGCYGRW